MCPRRHFLVYVAAVLFYKPIFTQPLSFGLCAAGAVEKFATDSGHRTSAKDKLLEYTATEIELCQQKVLKARHFRLLARKNEGNFGKKREGWTVPALLTYAKAFIK